MGPSEKPYPAPGELEESRLEEIVSRVLGSEDPESAMEAACAEHPAWASRIRRSFDELRKMRLLAEPVSFPAVLENVGGFRLKEVLGRGGMGVVYRAVDAELGREVALKVLRPELLHFEDSRRRFQREIESVSRLRHPGIVSVYSAGEDAGVPFFTMELVDGVPLSRTIAKLRGQTLGARRGADLLGPDPPRKGSSTGYPQLADDWTDACLQVGRMIAEALQHAHEQGVYHRDVKPSNVLIDEHGRARLLDFGLARLEAAQQLTRSAAFLGSLPYMPPEQVKAHLPRPGPRQDVYALGVTLYELLTLTQPFLADSSEATRGRVVAGECAPLRRVEPGIGRECAIVCHKAMELDPARRYGSARELAEDLDNLLQRRPIKARPAGPLLRTWRFAQRHPTASVGVVLGALVALASVLAMAAALRSRQIERDAVRDLVDSNVEFVFEFAQGLQRIPGNLEVRVELLQQAVDQLAQLEGEAGLDAARLARIGEAHLALADVLGRPDKANVGLRELARERYLHVIEDLAGRIAVDEPRVGAILRARASIGLAAAVRFGGDHERAIELHEQAIEALRPHLEDAPTDPGEREVERLFIKAQAQLASVAGSQGRHEDALRGFEAVRERRRLQLRSNPDDEDARFNLSGAGADVALALYMLGEPERAVAEYRPCIDLLDAARARRPDDARLAFRRLRRGVPFAEILIEAGRLDEAIAECREVLALCEELAAADPDNASLPAIRIYLLYDLGWAYQERAAAAREAGTDLESPEVRAELTEARRYLRAAHDLFRECVAAGHMQAGAREERIVERLEEIESLLGER